MHRKYDTARYLLSCQLLREAFPGCAITTDLIVGFPQETEEEFSATLAFLETVQFSAMHIFPYSRRTGTPAADMPGQIPQHEKEQRAARAGALEAQMRRAYQSQFLGKTLPVLFEQQDKAGHWTGHTPNYILVEAPGVDLRNTVCPVRITALTPQGLLGELVPAET
jgi:threonylcarbamoyladenosine tRNA methylthiotransferase MtaB